MAIISGVVLLFLVAPESYFIERIRQVIPQWQDGGLYISRQSNLFGRFWYAEMAWGMFLDSPLIGNGYYSFRELSPIWSMSIIGDSRVVPNAHNSFLQVLALLGFLFFSWLLWRITAFLYKTRKYAHWDKAHNFLWQFSAGNTIFLFLTALFSSSLLLPYDLSLNMILLGCLVERKRENSVP